MGEDVGGGAAAGPSLERLRALRGKLLHLHKVLLDSERAEYEAAHGRVTAGELLQLALNDRQFAWLRGLSELVVLIDEALDPKEPAAVPGADALLAQARKLLKPSEEGSEFARRYFAALQREPEAVLAHREATRLLSDAG
ncbi:MAG: hypothetical protein JOZ96_04880 [Acidobacteria bacterium]|nr:hypothetical protein [Acidobacteriota bacterium]